MLTREEIGTHLAEMDGELAVRGLTGEVVLCGGAVMAYVFDILEKNIPTPRLTPKAGFFAKEMFKRAREDADATRTGKP